MVPAKGSFWVQLGALGRHFWSLWGLQVTTPRRPFWPAGPSLGPAECAKRSAAPLACPRVEGVPDRLTKFSPKSSPTASAHPAGPDHPGASRRAPAPSRRAKPAKSDRKFSRFLLIFGSWPVLGRSWPCPWPSWVLLGALLGLLGPLLAVLGHFFASWAVWGPSLGFHGANFGPQEFPKKKNTKNHRGLCKNRLFVRCSVSRNPPAFLAEFWARGGSKITPRRPLGPFLGLSRGLLGPSWRLLGPFSCLLGSFWA